MMIRTSHRVLTEGAPKGHLQFLGLGRRRNKVATPKFATSMGDVLHSISNFFENTKYAENKMLLVGLLIL